MFSWKYSHLLMKGKGREVCEKKHLNHIGEQSTEKKRTQISQ